MLITYSFILYKYILNKTQKIWLPYKNRDYKSKTPTPPVISAPSLPVFEKQTPLHFSFSSISPQNFNVPFSQYNLTHFPTAIPSLKLPRFFIFPLG